MFITAVKTAIVEALNAGFSTFASSPSNNSLDLTPNSITIEYPLEMVEWPAIFVQFRATKIQWHGINPDNNYPSASGYLSNGINYPSVTVLRDGYFEGNIDLQIMAMHSEERDRLLDSVVNLVLMDYISPASIAFTQSILNNTLVGMTLMLDKVTFLGDSVSPGTPFSPEELTYEASIRIPCIGDFYGSKYSQIYPQIAKITSSGSQTINIVKNY